MVDARSVEAEQAATTLLLGSTSTGGVSSDSPTITIKPIEMKGAIRRKLHAFEVKEVDGNKWAGKVMMSNDSSQELPQHHHQQQQSSASGTSRQMDVPGKYSDKVHCTMMTEAFAPPVMALLPAGQQAAAACRVCDEGYNACLKPLNCYNCGYLMCPDCAEDLWPRSMLPASYVLNCRGEEGEEPDTVRTCIPCNKLMEKLVYALKAGDLETVQRVHATGNINLYQPFALHPDAPFAVSSCLRLEQQFTKAHPWAFHVLMVCFAIFC
mmetsp:Transcript_15213/g.25349  ORF Transcript_15213/g.25349 Transcript_15213/m.25349 type:complete len:267 (-) Transcript_15213:744-1544(-)